MVHRRLSVGMLYPEEITHVYYITLYCPQNSSHQKETQFHMQEKNRPHTVYNMQVWHTSTHCQSWNILTFKCSFWAHYTAYWEPIFTCFTDWSQIICQTAKPNIPQTKHKIWWNATSRSTFFWYMQFETRVKCLTLGPRACLSSKIMGQMLDSSF